MSDIAVEVDHVWKKFRRGEIHDSLRDLIPALARRLFARGRPAQPELAAEEFWALRDVAFQVRWGEVLGIVGTNGAGKSTLLKVLSRILKPDRGRMAVRGRLRALIEIAAGFHGDLTGRENIYLNGTLLGMKKREIDCKFDAIVDFAGIEPFLDTPVKRYSSGMYARLGFAVAAHLDPEILVVDEVLAVGDAEFQKKCLGRMHQTAEDGRTVLFVSHNMDAVASLCTRCILLQKGPIAAEGDSPSIIARYLETLPGDGHVRLEDRPAGLRGKPLRLASLCTEDADGRVERRFGCRQPVRFRLGVQGIPGTECYAGMAVRTISGQLVLELNSGDGRGPMRLLSDRGEIVVEMRGLGLNNNSYWISVWLADGSGTIQDSAANCLHFEVWDKAQPPVSSHAAVRLLSSWRMEPAGVRPRHGPAMNKESEARDVHR
jgi:lipopolysaccharide transport system ATP-binding protein